LVCMTGLRALSTLDPATAFPLLVAALYHADEEVVNTALELLAATERRDWLEATADALLDHAHWEVRANTARAIATLGVVALAPALEERLLAEGEDLVRRQLEAALRILRGQGS
jgi:HEAT repeat protein